MINDNQLFQGPCTTVKFFINSVVFKNNKTIPYRFDLLPNFPSIPSTLSSTVCASPVAAWVASAGLLNVWF